MGMLRDVLDTIKDIRTIGSVEDHLKTKRYSSISKRSLEGTLQFPVIVSRSMDIDTLQMISKSLERQFASFVQISLTMDPSLRLDKEKDVVGYLRKFHQNTGTSTDVKDVLNFAGQALEHFNVISDENDELYIASVLCEGSTANTSAANREQLGNVLDHLNTSILNEMYTPRKNVYNFPDRNLSAYYNETGIVTEAMDDDDRAYKRQRDAIDDVRERNKFSYQQQKDQRAHELAVRRQETEELKAIGSNAPKKPSLKDMDVNRMPQNILRDNDSRKANELVPTTLQIRTSLFDANGQQQGFFDFIIGVKATMHPVSSEEMVTNVVGACKNNSKVFNFIRWTTGEISFFKDFVFNIQEIKEDVFNRSSGSSAWWLTLKRRRSMAKLKNLTFMGGQLLPNATLVMSIDEIEHIKSVYGFDLMDVGFASKVMSQYFLLSLVVVDNSAQIAHFLFDGQGSYQAHTFSSLEKENTNKADLKEVMKIINRTNMV